MFVCTITPARRRTALLVLLAGLLLCLAVLGAGWLHGRQQIHLPDEASRLAYIRSLGYTPAGPAQVQETVTIPQWFDPTYAAYNTQLRRAGFDLSSWRGYEVTRYTYLLQDGSDQGEPLQLHLLLWEDRLIGGDVCSPLAGGFLTGLTAKETP